MKTCVEGTLLDQFGFDSSGCMTKNVLEKAIGFNLKVPKGKYIIRDCDCLFGRYWSIQHMLPDANIVMPTATSS